LWSETCQRKIIVVIYFVMYVVGLYLFVGVFVVSDVLLCLPRIVLQKVMLWCSFSKTMETNVCMYNV
jgi:hypothetical protein